MKRYGFIYNPAARGSSADSKFEELSRFVEQLPGSHLFYSDSREHISQLVKHIVDEVDVVVACGGDGTVREVATELINHDKTLGIIPLGTGNDLSKTLNIPADLPAALDLLLNGKTIHMDVGQCNDFIFLNTLGFGFDGLTNYYAHQMEWLPAILRYLVSALRANFLQKPFKVKFKGKKRTIEQDLIMAAVANGRVEGGSFWISPHASVTDGKLNLVTIKPLNKWIIPVLLPLFLYKKGDRIPQVQNTEIEGIEVLFQDKVKVHADGEIIENSSNEFRIALSGNKLPVICGL